MSRVIPGEKAICFDHLSFPVFIKSLSNKPIHTLDTGTGDFTQAVHLQWFAAEDEGRSEDPTEYKIRKAREEGKVAKSTDLTSAVVLIFGIVTFGVSGTYIFSSLNEMISFYYNRVAEIDVSSTNIIAPTVLSYFLKLALPVIGATFMAALLGNLLQVGFVFSLKPVTPDFTKIIPRLDKFLQRAFFSPEAAFNLFKSIGKVLIIGLIGYINISSEIKLLINLSHATFAQAVSTICLIAFRIMIEAAIAMALFAIPDYLFQRHQHLESLRMSRQEVKEERKQYEGDPLVKSRLKERMRQLLSTNAMSAVPEADVVITNPTHYAVAMKWKRDEMSAPMVVAKGADNMAFRIREIAKDNGVPIIENKPLARVLYAELEIGDVIPEKYYEVMALIIRQVYRMRGVPVEEMV